MRIAWDHRKIRALVIDAIADGRFRGPWDIALRAGVSPSTLSLVLNGKRGMRIPTAARLAAVLGVSVRDLMLNDDHTQPSFPHDQCSDGAEGEINFANGNPRGAAPRGSSHSGRGY